MATSNQPIYPQVLSNSAVQILPADTTTKKVLCTAGVNGSKVEWINVQSTDTAARDITITLSDGTTDYPLVNFSCLANAGNTNNIPAISVFSNAQIPTLTYDSNGNKFLYLEAGWSIKVSSGVTVTAAKAITFITQLEDF